MEKAEEGGPLNPPSNGEGGTSSNPPSNGEGGSASSNLPESKASWLHVIGAILGLGLVGAMIWFLVAHSYPISYIDEFDVIALTQKTKSPTTNSSHYSNDIHFRLMLMNRGNGKGAIYYDALNLTFFYKHNNLNKYLLIGNALMDPFRQGGKFRRSTSSAYRDGDFVASGIAWENVTTPAIFRVELVTATRYDNGPWKSKRRRMVVGADIKVNDEGSLVKMQRLRSNAGRISKSRFEFIMGILVILIFVHS